MVDREDLKSLTERCAGSNPVAPTKIVLKLYGPYKSRKDGRWRITIKYIDGSMSSISYPKYLVEQNLGRVLSKDETVDHIDRNPDNNSLDNLQILHRSEHGAVDAIRLIPSKFVCPICKLAFILDGRRLQRAARSATLGQAGPFCSKVCAGVYSSSVRDGGNKIQPVEIERKYFRLDKKQT